MFIAAEILLKNRNNKDIGNDYTHTLFCMSWSIKVILFMIRSSALNEMGRLPLNKKHFHGGK